MPVQVIDLSHDAGLESPVSVTNPLVRAAPRHPFANIAAKAPHVLRAALVATLPREGLESMCGGEACECELDASDTGTSAVTHITFGYAP